MCHTWDWLGTANNSSVQLTIRRRTEQTIVWHSPLSSCRIWVWFVFCCYFLHTGQRMCSIMHLRVFSWFCKGVGYWTRGFVQLTWLKSLTCSSRCFCIQIMRVISLAVCCWINKFQQLCFVDRKENVTWTALHLISTEVWEVWETTGDRVAIFRKFMVAGSGLFDF